jgi:KAP family P-loop domain
MSQHAASPTQTLKYNPSDSVASDRLGRLPKARALTEFIELIDEPFVLSLEGQWGSGKTTFIKQWKDLLSSQGHIPIYINAWETDFASDPLAPIATAFLEASEKLNIIDAFKPTTLAFAKAVVVHAARSAMANTLQFTDEDIRKELNSEALKSLEIFKEQKSIYADLKAQLDLFANAVKKQFQGKSKIVVLIDELDRCRPSYAIDMLERIKHIFDIEGYIFVLAIDRQQLNASVRHTFGVNTDTEEYLGRFIDFRTELTPIEPHGFFIELNRRYKLVQEGSRLFYDMCDLAMNDIFKVSLRTQSQLFLKMRALNHWEGFMNETAMKLMPFMVTLHHVDRSFFTELVKSRNIDKLAQYITSRGFTIQYNFDNTNKMYHLLSTMIWFSYGNRSESDVALRFRDNHCNINPTAPSMDAGVFDHIASGLVDLEQLA